ncbi:TetR/AcrR family transcriptional regulator [Paenibacillus polymyxa]|uniref:TetR/AcrR family transcriptional regulator n=1 Tax=Paenibacillus polymyxa TaxID=1406 RepID=UPI0027D7A41B|nr:TetR/AcrR family transcriptional regulator [Paenibacillus polymyxa]
MPRKLSIILKEVGIQKPFIYYYFKSKDDLFLDVFREVTEKEIHFIESVLPSNMLG